MCNVKDFFTLQRMIGSLKPCLDIQKYGIGKGGFTKPKKLTLNAIESKPIGCFKMIFEPQF